MSRPSRWLAAAGCLAAIAGVAAQPAAAAKPKKKPSSGQTLNVLMQMSLKPGLAGFVRQVSDPDSRHYRQYQPTSKLIKRFGSTKQTRTKTKQWAVAHHVALKVDPTGLFATATVSPAQAASLFNDGRAVAASAGTNQRFAVPEALDGVVTGVSTLPEVQTAQAVPTTPGAPVDGYGSARTSSGTPAGCTAGQNASAVGHGLNGFTPNQYMTAYGHQALRDRGLTGKGIRVGVLEIDGFNPADIQTFAECFGIKLPVINTHAVGMKNALPPADETTMDLEILSAVAPGVDSIEVYEGNLLYTLASVVQNERTRPDVLSLSLDGCENGDMNQVGGLHALDAMFGLLAAAGTSTFVATGDQGSTPCKNANGDILPVQGATYPSTSAYVTAVGGTNAILNADNTLQQQIVWNNAPGMAGGTSGSESLVWARPWWQSKWGVKESVQQGTTRATPDIAALADVIPGYALYCTATQGGCATDAVPNGGWLSFGGTSAATPLMAAGIVLANEAAAKRGQPTLGLINPLLYKLADSKAYAKVLSDVTVGTNDIGTALPAPISDGQPVGCCPADKGYDLVSGWGSLKVAAFSDAALAYGARAKR
jgi:subtilase family serine protease